MARAPLHRAGLRPFVARVCRAHVTPPGISLRFCVIRDDHQCHYHAGRVARGWRLAGRVSVWRFGEVCAAWVNLGGACLEDMPKDWMRLLLELTRRISFKCRASRKCRNPTSRLHPGGRAWRSGTAAVGDPGAQNRTDNDSGTNRIPAFANTVPPARQIRPLSMVREAAKSMGTCTRLKLSCSRWPLTRTRCKARGCANPTTIHLPLPTYALPFLHPSVTEICPIPARTAGRVRQSSAW